MLSICDLRVVNAQYLLCRPSGIGRVLPGDLAAPSCGGILQISFKHVRNDTLCAPLITDCQAKLSKQQHVTMTCYKSCLSPAFAYVHHKLYT
jgi:hypothetical protein